MLKRRELLAGGIALGALAGCAAPKVRPAITPVTSSCSRACLSEGLTQLLVGPTLSRDREQTKVRDSTLATSFGSDRA